MITRGLLDLQVNGFAGVDFNAGPALTAAAMDHALEAMLATGVTACLPTLITAPEPVLAARFAALDAAVAGSRLGPVMCPGYHLEGPFLNPAPGYAGCHPPAAMVAPDAALLARLGAGLRRPILLLTLAPELPGAVACIRAARAAGMVVAIGHSAAGMAEVRAAALAGASLSTHLGNGLPQTLPKLDNTLMAQMAEDGLAASFIADGIHVPPHALGVMLRAKGPGRGLLVTDAVAAAASLPGEYDFAGMRVQRHADGSVRVPGAAHLAGSGLSMDQAVRNLVAWELATAAEAVALAGAMPAQLLQPALAAHGLALPVAEVGWDEELRVTSVRVGDVARRWAH